MKQVGVAVSLFVEAGLLAQHRLGQPIDIGIWRGVIGDQGGGDGKGGGGFQITGVDAGWHLAALIELHPFQQLIPNRPFYG
ncbi:hypothetical protein D3C80_1896540 [compost metagenome]